MQNYRKVLKEHFESIPQFKKLMELDTVFWGIGLLISIIGETAAFYIGGALASTILVPLGFWMMWFGIALAFIKKHDLGIVLPFGIMAIFDFIMIIVLAVLGASVWTALLNAIAYAVLFYFAYQASVYKKKAAEHRVSSGAVCGKCGASIPAGAAFCPACGAEKPAAPACPACGQPVQEGAEFCDKCGARLTKKADERFCPTCGAAIKSGNLFCPTCGTSLQKHD